MASEPARTRLRRAILCLVLLVTFGHATACHSPALDFSAEINFAMKRPAFCSAVLRHSPSFWAAVVHWSALMPKALRSSRKTPSTLFPSPPRSPVPHQFSEHYTLRQSRTLHACHTPREQDPPSELLSLLLLFLTFSVLVANPEKLLYTVANPARGLLNRKKRTT